MPVPTLISQLSTTASLNSPDGAVDAPSSIDDYQRAHASFIAVLRDQATSIINGGTPVTNATNATNATGAPATAAGLVRATDLQAQTVTKFTTGGTSTAFTGAPNPPVTSNAAGQRFTATLHAAPTGPFTLSVSGQPAMNVFYWDTHLNSWQFAGPGQAKQWYPCDVVSDGINWILLNPIPIRTALMAVQPAGYTTSATLTAVDMNKLIYYWGSGAGTLTLPAVPLPGDTAIISAISTGTCTIARSGLQVIHARGVVGATSTSIAPGESISLVFDSYNWIQAAGSLPQQPPTGLGIGQTWQTVTRAPGTTYYNTTGKPIVLSTRASNNATAQQNVYGYVNGVEVAVDGSSFGGQKFGVDFIIPNGAGYSFGLSGGIHEYAIELR